METLDQIFEIERTNRINDRLQRLEKLKSLIPKEQYQEILSLILQDKDEALDLIYKIEEKLEATKQKKAGYNIIEAKNGRLHPPNIEQYRASAHTAEYQGTGNLLQHFRLTTMSLEERLELQEWIDDLFKLTQVVNFAIKNKIPSQVLSALGPSPSKAEIVLYTIAILISFRANKKTIKKRLKAWLQIFSPTPLPLSEATQTANICTTQAIRAQILAASYNIHGRIIETHVNPKKPSEPHNYFQSDIYPNDQKGPIIDPSSLKHLNGFLKDPIKYDKAIATKHKLQRKPLPQSKFDEILKNLITSNSSISEDDIGKIIYEIKYIHYYNLFS